MLINVGINNKNQLLVDFPYNKELVEVIQTLPSREFDKKNKVWKLPLLDLPILRDSIAPFINQYQAKITLHPKAQETYLEQVRNLKQIRNIAIKDSSDFEIFGLKRDIRLYDFQRVGAEFLYNVKRGLMAFDMGLGKTIISITAASRLIHEGKVKKILIICPASLKYNWALELAKFTNHTYTVVGGDKKEREKLYNKNSAFIIVNYDLLRHDIDIIKEIEWDLVISDEIQRAKNYSSSISKNIKKIDPEYVFALTGTPIENSIMELFTIMRFINPKVFGSNASYFKQRYCETDGWGKVESYKNLEEIDRKLSYFMIRRKKRDVLKDLPELIVNNYYVTLNAQERALYNEYKSGIVADLKAGKIRRIDILSKVIYLKEIGDCINLVQEGPEIVSSKLEELNRILGDLPSESKIVIFTEYEKMAQIIEKNIPIKSVHLHGGVKNDCKMEKQIEKEIKKNTELQGQELDLRIHEEKQNLKCASCPYYKDDSECNTRKKLLAKFDNEPDIKALISTNAGKEGINCQVANYVLNYDRSWNPGVNNQRTARIDRIGQFADHVFELNLICLDTIDERIEAVNADKSNLSDRLIDRSDMAVLKTIDTDTLLSLL